MNKQASSVCVEATLNQHRKKRYWSRHIIGSKNNSRKCGRTWFQNWTGPDLFIVREGLNFAAAKMKDSNFTLQVQSRKARRKKGRKMIKNHNRKRGRQEGDDLVGTAAVLSRLYLWVSLPLYQKKWTRKEGR